MMNKILLFSFLIIICILLGVLIPAQPLLVKNPTENTNDPQFDSPSFAELSFYPNFHNFSNQYQGIEANTTFEIWNSGCCGLTYNIIDECEWVNVSPTYGHSYGEKDIITVTINTTTLPYGEHSCDIVLDTSDSDGIFKVKVNIVEPPNHPPHQPFLNGPSAGNHQIEQTFTARSIDQDNDQLWFLWDWDDGTMSEWIGPADNNTDFTQKHRWSEEGSYQVRVQAKDEHGAISDWSDPLSIEIPKNKNHFSFLSHFFQWIMQYFK